MGFGKKRKKKEEVQDVKPVVQKVDIRHNPLYPPKQESEIKEIATSIGIAAVCLVLTGVIVTKFSYSYNTSSMASQQSQAVQEDYQESVQENDQEETGAGDVAEETAEARDADSREQSETEGAGTAEAGTEGADNKDYIIADSDSRVIAASELEGLSEVELSRARNEIYARHGRKFKDPSLQEYFNAKDWYHGTIEPEQFTEEMLNSTEKANTETILSYEKAKGYK